MTKAEQFAGCILGGAIGDAWGSSFENQPPQMEDDIFWLAEKPTTSSPQWNITDDTQLTLATIETMIADREVHPASVAQTFLRYYQSRTLRGLGTSTLKALRELAVGGHWSLVGRRGEYAAGNGAAMRIAPLAFRKHLSRRSIRDICSITHDNDEAYAGALAIIYAIRFILNGSWRGESNLIPLLIKELPDTRVRDRLIAISAISKLEQIGQLGNSGFVVDSVPLALAAANQIKQLGFENMYQTLIDIGGDTDTNCSIAGQVAGTLLGRSGIPAALHTQLSSMRDYPWIMRTIERFIAEEGWE